MPRWTAGCLPAALMLVPLWSLPLWAAEPDAARPPLVDLDGHFPMTVPQTPEQWHERAEALRLQVRVALGLHPMPALAEPQATIHGRRRMDGYTVEKVILESLPGHFVTGSLYRPNGDGLDDGDAATARPAVLYAHGHWSDGRFYQTGDAQVRQLIASGAERFENAAINHMQAACVQLARMGIVVLQYDMIGYADSQQISFQRAHRYGINDSNPPTTELGWPLYSATAEGYGQSIMALQTINSLQAFEMLSRLDDVDPERIAITGASGGGTQSFIASAVEPRLAAALPAVMVSTGMQGGCVCENACGLRVASGNIELAGLTAPRPLAMTTANDWTINMPEDGFPELVRLYEMLGNPKGVELFAGAHFPHNYNHVTRTSMYGWMNRLFGLGLSEPVLESDFELLTAEDLTVWDDDHRPPPSGIDGERQMNQAWAQQIDAALALQADDTPQQRQQKLELLGQGWRSIAAWAESVRGHAEGNHRWVVPPDGAASAVRLVAWAADHNPPQGAQVTLAVGDPWADPGDPQAPLVANPRPAAAYTYGYNPPPVIRRLAVLIDLLEPLADDTKLQLHCGDDEVILAALAGLQRPDLVESIRWSSDAADPADPLRDVDSIRHPGFIPNGLRYQGFAGLRALLGQRLQGP